MTQPFQNDYVTVSETPQITSSIAPFGDDPKMLQSDISIFQMLSEHQSAESPAESKLALILVDARRRLFAISPSAADVLNIPVESVRGEAIEHVADGILEVIALRPNAIMTTTMFEIAGKPLFANTRTLFGRNQQFLGWVVSLHDDLCDALGEFRSHHSAATNVISTLQHQIQNMQELIAMLPKFNHHHYWHYLLMQHIERLTDQMAQQVQLLNPPLA